MAASLSATVVGPAEMDSCLDHKEQWRGALLIREKKVSCLSYLGGHRAKGLAMVGRRHNANDHGVASTQL